MKRQHNIGLLVIDYLQLINSTGRNKENRVQEIAEISQGLKAIAKELDIPVITASQLSRAVESREDKRPLLSDLRESGNIEQDADIVMFIYREEYYLSRKIPSTDEKKLIEWQEKMEKVENIAEIIIAKQRNGPVGNFHLRYDNKTTAFDNLENIIIRMFDIFFDPCTQTILIFLSNSIVVKIFCEKKEKKFFFEKSLLKKKLCPFKIYFPHLIFLLKPLS